MAKLKVFCIQNYFKKNKINTKVFAIFGENIRKIFSLRPINKLEIGEVGEKISEKFIKLSICRNGEYFAL